MVHQHFRLVQPLTVAENVLLGWSGRHDGVWFTPRRVEPEVASIAERFAMPIDPHARIWQLSVGEQQRVEILKALYRDATHPHPRRADDGAHAAGGRAALRHPARDDRRRRDRGVHLAQAARGARRLRPRHGAPRRQGRGDRADRGLGRALPRAHDGGARHRADPEGRHGTRDRRHRSGAEGRLRARATSERPRSTTCRSRSRAGEILGVAGVAGNGQRELAEVIAGERPRDRRGRSRSRGRDQRGTPWEAIEAGLGYVPEERMGVGVAPGLSIADNLILKSYRAEGSGPMLHAKQTQPQRHGPDRAVRHPRAGPEDPRPRAVGRQHPAAAAGARAVPGTPGCWSPPRRRAGLDVAATESVRRLLVESAARGVGVLLISEDLDEILDLSDRIAGDVPRAGSRASSTGTTPTSTGSA